MSALGREEWDEIDLAVIAAAVKRRSVLDEIRRERFEIDLRDIKPANADTVTLLPIVVRPHERPARGPAHPSG